MSECPDFKFSWERQSDNMREESAESRSQLFYREFNIWSPDTGLSLEEKLSKKIRELKEKGLLSAGDAQPEMEKKWIEKEKIPPSDQYRWHMQQAFKAGTKMDIQSLPLSQIKHQEQRRYLYLYTKYGNHLPPDMTEEERVEITEYQALKRRVMEEQRRFQEWLEKMANRVYRRDYEYIHPEGGRYLESYLSHRRKEVDLYPKYYNALSSFPLQCTGAYPKLVFNTTLLQMGNIPKMSVPVLGHGDPLSVKLEREGIERVCPSVTGQHKADHTWQHLPVSMDNNAEMLANQHRAHIVISSSALQCLVDNHAPKHTHPWEIPFTVKEYTVSDGDITHRTVYIDRPFISRELTTKDKNTKLYKRALRAMMIKPTHSSTTMPHVEIKADPSDHPKCDTLSDSTTVKSTNKGTALKRVPSSQAVDPAKDDELTVPEDQASIHVSEITCTGEEVSKKSSNRQFEGWTDADDLHIEDLESFGVGSTSLSLSAKKAQAMKDEDFLKMISGNKTVKGESKGLKSQRESPQHCSTGDDGTVGHATASGTCSSYSGPGKSPERTPDPLPLHEGLMVCRKGNDNSNIERGWKRPRLITTNSACGDSPQDNDLACRTRCDSSDSTDSEKLVIDADHSLPQSGLVINEPPASPDTFEVDTVMADLHCKVIPMETYYPDFDGFVPGSMASPLASSDRESPTSPGKDPQPQTSSCIEIPIHRESDLDETMETSEQHQNTGDYGHGRKQTHNTSIQELKKEKLDSEIYDSEENLVIDWRSESHDSQNSQSDTGTLKSPRRKSARISSKRKIGEVKQEHTVYGSLTLQTDSVSHEEMEVREMKEETRSSRRVSKDSENVADIMCEVKEELPSQERDDSDEEITFRVRRCRSRRLIHDDEEDRSNSEGDAQKAGEKPGRGRPRKATQRRRRGSGRSVEAHQFVKEESVETLTNQMSNSTRGRGRGRRTLEEVHSDKEAISSDMERVIDGKPARGRGRPRKTSKAETLSFESCEDENMERTRQKTEPEGSQNRIPQETEPESSQNRIPQETEPEGSQNRIPQETGPEEKHITDPLARRTRIANKPKLCAAKSLQQTGGATLQRGQEETTPNRQTDQQNLFPRAVNKKISMDKGKATPASVSILDSMLQMQEQLLVPRMPGTPDVQKIDQSQDLVSKVKVPDQCNVTYGSWSFGGFKVITRVGYHGVVKKINQQPYFIHVSPKLEYQADFGMEQVTVSELSRDWISCYIRPHCKLLRVRINTPKNEIMAIEELDLPLLLASNQTFNPVNSMLMLQNIFHKLHQLERGQYILQHLKGSNLCQIKKATDTNTKRGSYDLHFHHHNVFGLDDVNRGRVPWIPLDTTVLLPYHSKHGRIPATCEPEDFRFNQQKLKPKGKKKKNKNKYKPGKAF